MSTVRAIVGQAVDELRRTPLPATGDAAQDDGRGLERALADAERHPTDTTVVRRLVDEMTAAGGRLGQVALELVPPYWSEQARYAQTTAPRRSAHHSYAKRRAAPHDSCPRAARRGTPPPPQLPRCAWWAASQSGAAPLTRTVASTGSSEKGTYTLTLPRSPNGAAGGQGA